MSDARARECRARVCKKRVSEVMQIFGTGLKALETPARMTDAHMHATRIYSIMTD